MKTRVSMRDALEHPDLFGDILPGKSWANWRVLLIAAMGEELTDEERLVFQALTGREREPSRLVDEFWAIIGRRGGKTRAIAVLAAYIAALVDFADVLAPGERCTLPIISASLWQAGKCYQYLDGIFHGVPALKKLVTGQTADTISLNTRVDIECRPASFRTVRGGTFCAVIADEAAYWRSDQCANPDTEILNAVRPSLATTGGPLAVISSPYARRGEVYQTFKRDYGPNGDPAVLVAKAASRTMNSTLPQATVDRAFRKDPQAAAAEYGRENVEFRSDVEAILSLEVIEACTEFKCYERAPRRGVKYVGFVDCSSGSGRDSAALAIAHLEDKIATLDCVREMRPPFDPHAAVASFVETLTSYRVHTVVGDKWATGFVEAAFKERKIAYKQAEKTKSQLYGELLPLANSRRISLLDNERLATQLTLLERRVSSGGRDSIERAERHTRGFGQRQRGRFGGRHGKASAAGYHA